MDSNYQVAVVQHPPVFLNLNASIQRAKEYILEASSNDARLIVFPETWLPGYPVWLDYAPNAGVWNYPPAKTLFRLLVQNSISIKDSSFNILQDLAVKTDTIIVMGAHEKVGRTLYNTIFYFKPDNTFELHRKLMPTYTERLIWGMGDGSTLSTISDENVKIGGLICWEHWMPLARAAMHQLGEDIHVAQWPMVKDLHHIASRQYAFEAQCYVIAAGCSLTKKQMIDGVKSVLENDADEPALEMIKSIPIEDNEFVLKGGSAIINPDSSFLIEPLQKENGILYAALNMNIVNEGNLFLDTNGHYSRPDIFKLIVNTKQQINVTFE